MSFFSGFAFFEKPHNLKIFLKLVFYFSSEHIANLHKQHINSLYNYHTSLYRLKAAH